MDDEKLISCLVEARTEDEVEECFEPVRLQSGISFSESSKTLIFLRKAVNAENRAINLYRSIAQVTNDEDLEELMNHIAEEEEVHVGEFEKLLYMTDDGYRANVEEGAKEVLERR